MHGPRVLIFWWITGMAAASVLSAQQGSDPAVSAALLAKYKPTRAEFQFGHWIRVRVVPANPNIFLFEPEVWP